MDLIKPLSPAQAQDVLRPTPSLRSPPVMPTPKITLPVSNPIKQPHERRRRQDRRRQTQRTVQQERRYRDRRGQGQREVLKRKIGEQQAHTTQKKTQSEKLEKSKKQGLSARPLYYSNKSSSPSVYFFYTRKGRFLDDNV